MSYNIEMFRGEIMLNTSNFDALTARKADVRIVEKSDGDKSTHTEFVDFNNQYARSILVKEQGKFHSANARIYHSKQEWQVYYDYNLMADGLNHHFMRNTHEKEEYKTIIAYGFCEGMKIGPVRALGQYATFHYDNVGRLRAIRSDQKDSKSDKDFSLCFKEGENGLWTLLPFKWQNAHVDNQESVGPIVVNGNKKTICDIQYGLTSKNEKMFFVQQNTAGRVLRTFGVPLKIDIPEYIRLLSSPNGRWTEVFQEFPSYIGIDK
jgi:hypothetical protein